MPTKSSLLLILFLFAFSCEVKTIIDKRDQKQYTVRYSSGISWMTQSLSYSMPGDSSVTHFPNAATPALLYSLESARKACPDGWRLPSKKEWNNLIALFPGKKNSRSGRIISKSIATDTSLLNIQMNGLRLGRERHIALNSMTVFWTSSDTVFQNMEKPEWNGKRYIGYHFYEASKDSLHAEPTYAKDAENGYYCRCVKD